MDLFGRKRIAELERANANLNRRLGEWEDQWKEYTAKNTGLRNQVEYLVRTIRDIDEQLFKISQNADGSWTRVQSNFKTLCDGMTARKVAESNRIGDILRDELFNTYTPGVAQKRLK